MIKRLIDKFDSIQFPLWFEYLVATVFAICTAVVLAYVVLGGV
jgi:hypothetical protein